MGYGKNGMILMATTPKGHDILQKDIPVTAVHLRYRYGCVGFVKHSLLGVENGIVIVTILSKLGYISPYLRGRISTNLQGFIILITQLIIRY